MKEYNVIGEFSFEYKRFELLLDEDKKYFFLKINNNHQYEYITLEELVKLTRKFASNSNVLLSIDNNIDEQSDNIIDYQINPNPTKKRKRIIPAIVVGATIVALSLPLLSTLTSCSRGYSYRSIPRTSYTEAASEDIETQYTTATESTTNYEDIISYNDGVLDDATQKAINQVYEDIKKDNDNFQVETDQDGFHLKIIYDHSKLDDAFGYKQNEITYDTIKNTIKNNSSIPEKFKQIYLELANDLQAQYPNMDLRVWYENLKSMKILEVDEMTMKLKAISATAYACYRKDENTIYTVKDYDYVKGTWDYQVIIHEMCHPIRSGFIKKGDNEIRVQFENKSGEGVIIGEALNSLFSLRSYDQDEKDIAYQLQSNMIEIIVDCLDHYTYQDFVEHNITYLENEMNKQNNDNKAVEVLALMNLQYKDYHDEEISVPQSQFYKLYDYIAKMYYQKNIHAGMSYQEAEAVKQALLDKILYDVPKEYQIDKDHFTDYLKDYCKSIGISSGKTK